MAKLEYHDVAAGAYRTATGSNGKIDVNATSTLDTSTNIGVNSDTSATTDTGTFTLISLTKRLLTKITALALQLPASLGIKTAAASMSVAPASDGIFIVSASGATPADRSGTLTTGGTAQQVAAANAARKGWSIQNNSAGDLWVSTLATAVASQPSTVIPPGAYFESPFGGAGPGAISIIGATTGQAFTGREW